MTIAFSVFRCFLRLHALAQTPNPNCINSTKVSRLAPIQSPSVPPRLAVKQKPAFVLMSQETTSFDISKQKIQNELSGEATE